MTRWSPADLSKVLAKGPVTLHGLALRAQAASVIGRQRDDRMNRTESEYAILLEYRRLAGEIKGYGFERIKLRLADKTWYCPDFDVIGVGGETEFHEVKGGFIRDDAMVKFKVAREMHTWATFKLLQRKKGEWVQRS